MEKLGYDDAHMLMGLIDEPEGSQVNSVGGLNGVSYSDFRSIELGQPSLPASDSISLKRGSTEYNP